MPSREVERVRNSLLTDDVASRANILFRDGKLLTGKEGMYVRVLGTEEQLRRVEEVLGEIGTRVTGDELEVVLKRLAEEDERALEGFGRIFGES